MAEGAIPLPPKGKLDVETYAGAGAVREAIKKIKFPVVYPYLRTNVDLANGGSVGQVQISSKNNLLDSK